MDVIPFRSRRRGRDLVAGQDLVSRTDLVSGRCLGPVPAQLAQDAAVAALLGGNLFGRLAMHPALTSVSDKTERGRVVNQAWRRYGTVNSTALAALVAGWVSSRPGASGLSWAGGRHRRLVLAKDIAVGAVVATGLASAVGGVEFAHQAPEGAVPLNSGSDPAPETPRRAAALKRVVNVLGGLNLAAEVSLLAVDALLARTT